MKQTRAQRTEAAAQAHLDVDVDHGSPFRAWFGKVATRVSNVTGSALAFSAALLIILVWLVTGPIFGFSDTWQLAINTGTTIVTFLMVFLIQNTQNRDAKATQLKLDELIRAIAGARNRFIGAELEPEERIDREMREVETLKDEPSGTARSARPPSHNGKPHRGEPPRHR